MARKKALLMTVGYGNPKRQDILHSMSHGMLSSINNFNPDLVVFFGSKDSEIVIESLKEKYLKEFGDELDFYEFVKNDDVDNFNSYFMGFKSKINELDEDYRIAIDYTSGTKTMTMSAAFASMFFRKELVFVSGERSKKKGLVRPGTEEPKRQNLYTFYDDLLLVKIQELFNTNRFESAKSLLEDMVNNEEADLYSKLLNAYSCFDNVDYEGAKENFDVKVFANKWESISGQIYANNNALNIINGGRDKSYYILASLLNNAKRRALEYKYDDAIARLYRSLELIAQIKLEEYNLNSSDLDIKIVKELISDEDYLFKLETKHDDSGKIKIGLVEDFELLFKLDDKLGKYYKENENKIKNAIRFRNSSILAHGLESKSKEEYENFEEIIYGVALALNKKMNNFIKQTEFPKFDI